MNYLDHNHNHNHNRYHCDPKMHLVEVVHALCIQCIQATLEKSLFLLSSFMLRLVVTNFAVIIVNLNHHQRSAAF